uniref:16S rRNA (cytosine(967)-C(5))-methyltransferase n=1 Tax=Candidatus Aschnera chinzeii TaxID=1485666 RepID=A0AAT9G4Y0_9ENTR|nr:MAG: 16S rRNA (cytosine(967)-C(5))-methyltransferase RsmB [Candidatus Aschnera chinzeii]
MNKSYNIRNICAQVIFSVFVRKQKLKTAILKWQHIVINRDKKLLYEITYGIMRKFSILEFYVNKILYKPLNKKVLIIFYLLIVGVYQLRFMRIPAYAVISETVNAVIGLKYAPFKKLVNAVLRNFKIKKNIFDKLINNNDRQYLHPYWLLQLIKKYYPSQWKKIILINNQKAPIWIRINRLYTSLDNYLHILKNNNIKVTISNYVDNGIKIEDPCSVNTLPGFNDGWITVQDISSQKCVELLEPKNYEHILDVCAAPGIKTTYILEIAPKAHVVCIDINAKRIKLIKENLNRLNLHADIIIGDACDVNNLGLKKQFDRILLDLPCSATGIIRRHPDIKWIRKYADISNLVILQYNILKSIWPLLKPDGILAYITCSILPEENEDQIRKFLFYHTNAVFMYDKTKSMQQILPGDNDGDGFFYAYLTKK